MGSTILGQNRGLANTQLAVPLVPANSFALPYAFDLVGSTNKPTTTPIPSPDPVTLR